jgi:hypothetical protein
MNVTALIVQLISGALGGTKPLGSSRRWRQ